MADSRRVVAMRLCATAIDMNTPPISSISTGAGVVRATSITCCQSLILTLDKALEEPQTKGSVFPVQIHGTSQLIDLREVLCVESFYRKLRFRLWNETIECYGSFSSLPEIVREQTIHCHKSFLANPNYIRTLDGKSFLMANGRVVPISRNRYQESRRALLAYCGQKLEEDEA